MTKRYGMLACGVATLAMMTSFSARAQEAAPPPAVPDATEEAPQDDSVIIVTATRRASPLSDVPIAVSAVTAASLQNSGANDIRQLNQLAPSLLVSSTGSEANGAARIRGVGTVGDNPGLESSVAVFIDGVYRSRTGAGLTDLGEIERIEVLRGPQGTLFGRNASAGLINIVSKGPEFTLGAKGELTYGNYDFWRAAASITGPVSEKIALRLDVERYVRPISFRPGVLEYEPAPGAPNNLAQRLVARLKEWTGQPWLVAAQGGGGAESAWERQKREEREAARVR